MKGTDGYFSVVTYTDHHAVPLNVKKFVRFHCTVFFGSLKKHHNYTQQYQLRALTDFANSFNLVVIKHKSDQTITRLENAEVVYVLLIHSMD